MSQKDGEVRSVVRAHLGRYRVTSSESFDLARFDPDDLPDAMPGKDAGKHTLAHAVSRLSDLQEILYANASWSLLLVFQAMDAGGKDSTISHVVSGVNPQGIIVTSFKAPGPRELAHDFLWRINQALPSRGMIGIFNRSHYEEVLVARVHPAILDAQNLPPSLVGQRIFDERIADIAAYEAYLGRQGTKIVKFFLNVSREEQKNRFLARLDEPDKTWKFNAADVRERTFWPQYRMAYEAAIAGTATVNAPWYVVPADRKWYMRLVVIEAIIAALEDMKLTYPDAPEEALSDLEAARRALERED